MEYSELPQIKTSTLKAISHNSSSLIQDLRSEGTAEYSSKLEHWKKRYRRNSDEKSCFLWNLSIFLSVEEF